MISHHHSHETWHPISQFHASHAVWHDAGDGHTYLPLANLWPEQGRIEKQAK